MQDKICIQAACPSTSPNSITLYNPNATNTQARNGTCSSDNTLTTASSSYGFYITTTSAPGSAAGDLVSVHFAADAEL